MTRCGGEYSRDGFPLGCENPHDRAEEVGVGEVISLPRHHSQEPVGRHAADDHRQFVGVRGELHLCVSLLERFGLGTREAQRSAPAARLVLVRDPQDSLLAFRADQVLGLRSAPESAVEAPPETLPEQLAACVRGVLPIDRLRVLLLDGDAVHACLAAGLYA